MEIRTAELDDLNKIAELKIRMFEEAGLLNLLADDQALLIRRKYRELYRAKEACHFLITSEDRIIAMAGGFVRRDIPYCFYKEGGRGFIGDMFTQPEFRNRGYGRSLLMEAINWLRFKGMKSAELLAAEKARDLYLKAGFVSNSESLVLKL